MKIIEDVQIKCVDCANAMKAVCGPTDYERKVAEWAFRLNGIAGGACHDSHEFASCALKKNLPPSGECAWFSKRAAKR